MRLLTRLGLALGALGWLALAAPNASAFSFGTFAPGDTIESIELSAAGSTAVSLTTNNPVDPFDDVLVYESSVSTITMTSGAVFNIALGDVLFASQLTLVSETNSPFFSTSILGAVFRNGVVADFTITDIGTGGSGLLLAADYQAGGVDMTAAQFFSGFPITGSLSGDFDVIGGNAAFTTAFGTQGNFAAELAGWLAGGVPPSSLCQLTFASTCSTDFANFTANPTTTIVPVAVPEPGGLALALATLGALGLRRRGR